MSDRIKKIDDSLLRLTGVGEIGGTEMKVT